MTDTLKMAREAHRNAVLALADEYAKVAFCSHSYTRAKNHEVRERLTFAVDAAIAAIDAQSTRSADVSKSGAAIDAQQAATVGAPTEFDHDIGADRFKVVKGAFWWHIRIGDGTANVGKFHSKLAAEDVALKMLTAFRDGAYMQHQRALSATPPAVQAKDAARYRGLRSAGYLDRIVGGIHPCDESRRVELTDAAVDRAIGAAAQGGEHV